MEVASSAAVRCYFLLEHCHRKKKKHFEVLNQVNRQYNCIHFKRSEKFLPCRKNQHLSDVILECNKSFLHFLCPHKAKQILTAALIQVVEDLFLGSFILIPHSCSKAMLFSFFDTGAGLKMCNLAFIPAH